VIGDRHARVLLLVLVLVLVLRQQEKIEYEEEYRSLRSLRTRGTTDGADEHGGSTRFVPNPTTGSGSLC